MKYSSLLIAMLLVTNVFGYPADRQISSSSKPTIWQRMIRPFQNKKVVTDGDDVFNYSVYSRFRSAADFHKDDSTRLDPFDQFIVWESFSNVFSRNKNKLGFTPFNIDSMDIEHIEIPIDHPNLPKVDSYEKWWYGADLGSDLLIMDFATYLPKEIKDALMFERDGQKWIRWPLSPFDSMYRNIIQAFLHERNIPYRIDTYFRGRSTASRSMIIKDPVTGHQFSFKTSSNGTINDRGNLQLRPYPARWGYLNRQLSDYYHSVKHKLKHLDVAWEAGMFGLPPVKIKNGRLVDSSMTIRLMEDVNQKKKYHMSGFVLTDDAEVERLARLNNMTSKQFRERAGEILGMGLAELNLILGFQLGSEHAQNIRIELGSDYKLTGKLIILDLSDGHPIKEIFEMNGQHKLLDQWERLVGDTNPVNKTSRTRQVVTLLSKIFPGLSIQKGVEQRTSELLPGFEESLKFTSVPGERSFEYDFVSKEHLKKHLQIRSECITLYH